jgi:hypothetical protein
MWEFWNKAVGHTVYAFVIATVGNGYAKIVQFAVAWVDLFRILQR